MRYVIAGNYAQARYWARHAGWAPTEWRYVSHVYDVHGIRDDASVVECGTPFLARTNDDVYDYLRARGVRLRHVEEFL